MFSLYTCLLVEQAIDFLDKLLRYDHQERPTAKEAMVVFSILYLYYILFRNVVSLFMYLF